MLKVHFKDSGEVWEFYEGDRLSRRWISSIIDNMRFFRKYWSDVCHPYCSHAVVTDASDNVLMLISVGPGRVNISRHNADHTWSDYAKEFEIHE